MSEPLLPAVEIEPGGPPTASVIWLHGLGADGHDFEPIVPELLLPEEMRVRFVFPHAPMRPVTINGGYVMRAWYDIKTLDLERTADEEDLETSRRQLEAWIRNERASGIPSERIVVAGFSQGGAIALYGGLAFEERLGGIVALSCYHPLRHRIPEGSQTPNARVPIFMAHGTYDPIVPLSLAEATVGALREQGYEPEWRTYPMPHSVSPAEITDLGRFLSNRLR
ncbi:MAG TPA: dienelactone hydrolase family protein [Vicinamibacteria bacterium]|nr:dienelactone hydrolase family protein [Vicinamibacteria bacterium]